MSDYQAAILAAIQNRETKSMARGLSFLEDEFLDLEMISGGAGFVFVATDGERRYAFKVFNKAAPQREQRYQLIHDHLEAAGSRVFADFRFGSEALHVDPRDAAPGWFPAVRMEWCEGETLDDALERALEAGYQAPKWIRAWLGVLAELRRTHTAHGDLHHGNVIVQPGGQMRLIDYDGMFVPSMAGVLEAAESGHPAYQHPARLGTPTWFGEHIDGVSALVILTTLAGVTPDLWDARDDEGLLLGSDDLEAPEDSQMLDRLSRSRDPAPRLVALLRDALRCSLGPCAQIDEAARICGVELTPINGDARAVAQSAQPSPQVDDLGFTIITRYNLTRWTAPVETSGNATARPPDSARGLTGSSRSTTAPKATVTTTRKPKPAPAGPSAAAVAIAELAAQHAAKRHWAKAQAAYDRALQAHEGFVAALVGRAQVKLQRGHRQSAFDDLGRALQLEPKNVDALLARAAAYRAAGQLSASLRDADRAFTVNPRCAPALVERGWTCLSFSSGHREQASDAFDRATKLDRDLAAAFAGRGVARVLRGHRREAITALDRALALDPNQREALAGRAALAALDGKPETLAALRSAVGASREERVGQHLVTYARSRAARHARGDGPQPETASALQSASATTTTPNPLPPSVPDRIPELVSRMHAFVPRLPASFARSNWTTSPPALAAVSNAPFLTRPQRRELTKRLRGGGALESALWIARWGVGEFETNRAMIFTERRLIWTYRGAFGQRADEAMWSQVLAAKDAAGLEIVFTAHTPLRIMKVADAVAVDPAFDADSLFELSMAINRYATLSRPKVETPRTGWVPGRRVPG